MKKRIDVIISSTSIDLPEHRAAVRDAILSLGLFPGGMETWPVRDENPVDLCQQMVDDAELFIGIYAHHYGWRPPGHDGKSITELEYDWATENGIPRLCFIMNENHPWPKAQMELDAREEMEAFKARVKEQFIGPFTTPDDLKAQVLAALAPYVPAGQDISAATPYLNWLHHTAMQSGPLRIMDPRSGDPSFRGGHVTVDQVYTPLDTRRQVLRDDEGHILPEPEGPGLTQRGEEEHERMPLTAMEAVNKYNRLVLLGDPGSGKSTFVSFLALCLTGHHLDKEAGWLQRLEAQGWTHGRLFPILVTLRDFAHDIPADTVGTAQMLWDHITRELQKRDCLAAEPVMRARVNAGRALLLLDGLDEVPPEKRDVVRDAVTDFMTAQSMLAALGELSSQRFQWAWQQVYSPAA